MTEKELQAKRQEINQKIKNAKEDRTYKIELSENNKVLKIKENAIKDLNGLGYTELDTTYISAKKYSLEVVDMLVKDLKSLGYTPKD